MMKGLPEPDSEGIVRVTAGLKIDEQKGTAMLVELNDSPVDNSPDDESDGEEMPTPDMPSPADVEKEIYE